MLISFMLLQAMHLISEYRHILAAENALQAQVKEAEHLPASTKDGSR